MKPNISLVLAVLLSLSFCRLSYAQAQMPEPVPLKVSLARFPIKITLLNLPRDVKGTDVTNIYTIKVDFAQTGTVNTQLYNIVYFLDDIYIKDYQQQRLPFTFQQNFKGMAPGPHVIRIEVEDGHENLLARGTITVNTVRSAVRR